MTLNINNRRFHLTLTIKLKAKIIYGGFTLKETSVSHRWCGTAAIVPTGLYVSTSGGRCFAIDSKGLRRAA